MAFAWKVKEFLEAHDVSAYRLMKEANLSQGTAYRLANNETNGLHLETLDAVIAALRRLSNEEVGIADLLEYRE
jgi:DNA-binding Xre family transcriptional regulator